MKIREAIYHVLSANGKTVCEIARTTELDESSVLTALWALEKLDLVERTQLKKGRQKWAPVKWKRSRNS